MQKARKILAAAAVVAALVLLNIGNIAPPSEPAADGGEEEENEDLSVPPVFAEFWDQIPPGLMNGPQPPSYVAAPVPYPGRWYTKSPLPLNRCDTPNGATARDMTDAIYEFGGENYNTSYDFNLKYDPSNDVWTVRAPMLVGREEFGIGVWKNKMFAISGHTWTRGYDFNPSYVFSHNENQCYDTINNTWEYKAPIPVPISWPASATVGNRIYIIGGWECGVPPLPSWGYNQVYDPINDTWSQKTPMPTNRTGASAVTLMHDGDEKIFVVGGFNGAGQLYNTNEMYNPKTNMWTTLAPMPTPRAWYSVGVLNNKLYCIGGATDLSGGVTNAVEVYDPLTNTWATDTPMPTARDEMGACSASGKIYVVAGWNPSCDAIQQYLNINEMFVPAQMNLVAKASPNPMSSNTTTQVTVSIAEYWGAGIPGASVALEDGTWGGTWGAVTDTGNGNYTCAYTPPPVSSTKYIMLNATATKTGYPIANARTILIVRPATPMSVSVSASPASVYGGNQTNITVAVSDFGSPVTSAVVTLQSGAGGSFGPVTDQGNGNYTAVFTAPMVAAQQQVVITANVTKGGSIDGQGSGTVTVKPPPQPDMPDLAVAVTATPQSVTSGTNTTIHVAVTSNGTGIDNATVALRDGSAGGSFGAVTEIGGGSYECVYTAPTVTTPKSVTITANASKAGYDPAEGSTAVTVNLNPTLAVFVSCNATEVGSGGAASLTVNVTNPLTGAGIGSALVAMDDGGAGGSFGSVSSDGLGNFFVDYAAPVVSSPTSVMLVANATHPGYNQGSGWAYLTVNPMALSIAVSTSKPSATSGDSIAVTAALSSSGAPVTGAAVAFDDGGAGGAFSTVSDNGDGTYTSSYTTPSVSSDTQVTITGSAALAGYADATATASVTVSPMTGATLKGTVTATPSSLQSGELSTVMVTVTADLIPVAGAQVSLDCGGQGSIDPASGLTDAAGTLVANYTAPTVTANKAVKITASFSKGGYVTGSATANITVDPAMPDLAVESSGIAVKKISDGTYEANITVKNLGQASVGDATYRVYLDDVLQGGDRAISVPGHGQAQASVSLTGVSDGKHTVAVKLDPDNLIIESSETNNEASGQFTAVSAGGSDDFLSGPTMYYIPVAVIAIILVLVVLMALAGGRKKKKKDDDRPAFARH